MAVLDDLHGGSKPLLLPSPELSSATGVQCDTGLLFRLRQGTLRRIRTVVLGSKGSLLVESLVSVMVFALVGAAVMGGASAARNTGGIVEAKSVGERIARNQMENVFNVPYRQPQSTPYPTASPPSGYSVSVVADEYLPLVVDIEIVTVTVTRRGEDILVLKTLRFNPN